MTVATQSISISAPSFRGLNNQQTGALLSMEWASEALNCAFDQQGRLGSRKGWIKANTTAISGAPDILRVHELILDNGISTIISAGGNKLYSGTTAPADKTGTSITTPTGSKWKFVNLNGDVIAAQEGHHPIFWDGGVGNFERLYDKQTLRANSTAYSVGDVVRVAGAAGTVYWHCTTGGTTAAADPGLSTTVGAATVDGTVTWTTRAFPVNGNTALSAFGRLWITDDNETTIYYSDLLQPWKFSGGTAGSLSLVSVWTHGMDTITALTEYNGRLVIFGRKSITLYQGADTPSTMTKEEQITDTGCIARDTVQHVGAMLLFLSDSGLHSLERAIQAGSLPFFDLSKNVRNGVEALIAAESDTLNGITSVYHEPEGFYLLTFISSGNTYCFDVKYPLEDGSLRTTTWSGIAPRGMISTRDRKLYMGFSGGFLGYYSGYTDNAATYGLTYFTAWSDLSAHAGSRELAGLLLERIKIPKRVGVVVQAPSGATLTLKIQYDYFGDVLTGISSSSYGTNVAEFNVSEFNVAEFSGGDARGSLSFPGRGSGKVLRIGLSYTSVSDKISFQQINMLAKIGRQAV